MQNLKTVVLLAVISGLLLLIGFSVGGLGGVIIALVIAMALNVGSYWFSADIVLKTSKAREIEYEDDRDLFRMIEQVAREAGMPMPRVYIMDTPQPNAFATGRSPKHAAVAVTTGIRRLLTDRELRGVLGHEMAHVANRDILTSSVVATVASAITFISFFAFWFGGRRDGGGLDWPCWPRSWRRLRPRSSSSRSAARASTRRIRTARATSATRRRWPRRWRSSSRARN